MKNLTGIQGDFGKYMGQAKLYKPVFLPELKESRLFLNAGVGAGEGRRKRAILGELVHCRAPSSSPGWGETGRTARGSRVGALVLSVSHRHTPDSHTPPGAHDYAITKACKCAQTHAQMPVPQQSH